MKLKRYQSQEDSQPLLNDLENTRKTSIAENSILDPRHSILKKIRTQNFFQRNFCRPFGHGSMRGSIITLLRMTLGIGIFAIPYYTKDIGLLTSLVMLLICGFISYFSFDTISTSAHVCGANSYQETIKFILGKKFYFLSKITFTVDFTTVVLIYQIAGWNLFQYLAYFLGIFKDEWLLDKNILRFDPWNYNVLAFRIGYFAVIYIVLFCNLLKDDLENIRFFSTAFVIALVFLILYIFVQMPFYRSFYANENKIFFSVFKSPSYLWVTSFYSLLSAYTCQIFIVKIRQELFLPTQRRIRKVIKTTLTLEFIIFALIASICYYSLGDLFTPQLIILRKSLNKYGIWEYFMTGLLLIFFLCSVMSLAVFNIPFKKYWIYLFHQKYEVGKKLHFFYSTVPFLMVSILAIFLCDVTIVYTVLSLTVWNFDAYFYTVFLKIKLISQDDYYRKLKIFLLYSFLIIFFVGCAFGVYYTVSLK